MDYILEVQNNRVFINGTKVNLEFPVRSAVVANGMVVVLFDPDSNLQQFGQFHNLIAVNPLGQQIWTAQLPTHESGDAYYKLISTEPLVALSVASYRVEIDPTNGKIVKKVFYK